MRLHPNDFSLGLVLFSLVYMYYSNETAPLCKILEQSDHYSWDIFYVASDIGPLFMEILHFEDLGVTKVSSTNAVFVTIFLMQLQISS